MDVTPGFTVWGLLAFRELRSLGSRSQMPLRYGIGLCWRLWWPRLWRRILPLSRQCCTILSKSSVHHPISMRPLFSSSREWHWALAHTGHSQQHSPAPCSLFIMLSFPFSCGFSLWLMFWPAYSSSHSPPSFSRSSVLWAQLCHNCSLSTGEQLHTFT